MNPTLRTAAGLGAASALLIVLAACDKIEVISGAMTLNSGYTYCSYGIVPRIATKNGSSVEVWPLWHNVIEPSQREFQDVKVICVSGPCGNNEPGKDNCRQTGTDAIRVKTNFTNEKYVVKTLPCVTTCAGYRGSW